MPSRRSLRRRIYFPIIPQPKKKVNRAKDTKLVKMYQTVRKRHGVFGGYALYIRTRPGIPGRDDGLALRTLAVVDLGQTAFGSFPEPVVQVYAGFLHGPADHIIADIPGTGEEVA